MPFTPTEVSPPKNRFPFVFDAETGSERLLVSVSCWSGFVFPTPIPIFPAAVKFNMPFIEVHVFPVRPTLYWLVEEGTRLESNVAAETRAIDVWKDWENGWVGFVFEETVNETLTASCAGGLECFAKRRPETETRFEVRGAAGFAPC
jgi:hypothetical protein